MAVAADYGRGASSFQRRRNSALLYRECQIGSLLGGLRFCSQSVRSKADIKKYPLLEEEAIVQAAREAKARGAWEFSIVAAGLAMRNRKELERVAKAIERTGNDVGLESCVSLGALSGEEISYLLGRGLRLTLMVTHRPQMIHTAVGILDECFKEMGIEPR